MSTTRIVIAQRGWVFIGQYSATADEVTLTDASVIRDWGTTYGLGQLAMQGAQMTTVLDPCGTVRFHPLAIVAMMDCNDYEWTPQP